MNDRKLFIYRALIHLFILFVFFGVSLSASETGLKVRFFNRITTVNAGQEAALQIYITNGSAESKIVVGQLKLPPGWQTVTSNDALIHLMPNQNVLQTIVLRIPDYQTAGEFSISYVVRARDNPNFYDKDNAYILVKEARSLVEDEYFEYEDAVEESSFEAAPCVVENEIFKITLTSDPQVYVSPDETFFVSYLLKNKTSSSCKEEFKLNLPDGWEVVPHDLVKLEVNPHDEILQVFGIKCSREAVANNYLLNFTGAGISHNLRVIVLPETKFKLELVNPDSCYAVNEPLNIELKYKNLGNTPIKFIVQAIPDPCCKIKYRSNVFEIGPKAEILSTIYVEPNLGPDDDKQFIKIAVYNCDTKEIIAQDTFTLIFTPPTDDEDPFIRIQSHVSFMALGDNGRHVLAIEWAGGGYVDPDRYRFMEFVFRIPTTTKNVIYNVDQRLYWSLSEPGWDISLGDTVYTLSPLVQRYRYGRGGGFDFNTGRYTGGAHYTQNTYNNDYNPKEAGAYFGYYPSDRLYMYGNYLHREVQEEPVSNIISLAYEYEATRNVHLEAEVGNDFVNHVGKKDKSAYRGHARGFLGYDTWFDIEKIYAGSAFYGYYTHVDMFSAILDFPVNCQMRANLGYTRLKQNFEDEYFNHYKHNDHYAPKPRQRQFNANISYNFLNGSSVTWNGLLFRAKDAGYGEQYDFFQRWTGFTATFSKDDWNVVGITSWGRQHDYLDHQEGEFLQRYYLYLSKQLGRDYFSTLFYEGGNTNYYDAKPWRTSYGGSLGYRYYSNSFIELFLQRVNNSCDDYQLNQASLRLSHTFSNYHSLDVSAQYFHYQQHYPNDFLFLVSYTIPFGMPVGKRSDIGHVSGSLYNPGDHSFVSDALVSLGAKQCYTDQKGRFNFKNMKRGSYDLKTEILPRDIIVQDASPKKINVAGGHTVDVPLFVINACSLYGQVSTITDENTVPLSSVRIIISRNQGEEIFTALTNEKGNYQFSSLRPGEWKIKVAEEYLPSNYAVDHSQLAFTLEPEEKREIIFKVKPVKREILPLE